MIDLSNILEGRVNLLYLCYEKDKVTLVTNKKHKVCNCEARLNVLHIVAKRNNESIQYFLKKSLALDKKFYCYTKKYSSYKYIYLFEIISCKMQLPCTCLFYANMQKRLKWRIPKFNVHLFTYYGRISV